MHSEYLFVLPSWMIQKSYVGMRLRILRNITFKSKFYTAHNSLISLTSIASSQSSFQNSSQIFRNTRKYCLYSNKLFNCYRSKCILTRCNQNVIQLKLERFNMWIIIQISYTMEPSDTTVPNLLMLGSLNMWTWFKTECTKGNLERTIIL